MNNRPVEQALATLLPTHAQDLPQELLSLAISLVAQSRSFSSSLKPEEEIARPYACAEIACKRLTRVLKLPPLLGHPPCPPRAYKKLYAFLDRSLSTGNARASASAPGTPSRAGSAPSTPRKGTQRTPSKTTATATPRGIQQHHQQQLHQQNTPTKSTPLKRALSHTDADRPSPSPRPQKIPKFRANGLSGSTIIADAPSWVMTSIRTVCKTLSTPAPRMSTWSRPPISRTLPPHIFAGVSTILYLISEATAKHDEEIDEEMMEFLEPVILAKDKENDEDFKEIINALIVAVYFLVLARRRQPGSSGDDSAEAAEAKKMDKKTFSEMRQTALVSLGLPATERRHREDVDQWIALVMEQGWAHGKEWFENVPLAGELDGDEGALGDELVGGVVEEDVGRGRLMVSGRGALVAGKSSRRGLLPGLGTMMQDRVDWLSEDRREDYLEWKADMLARIEQIERTAQAV
ncbi:hypothetical protein ABZX51_005598 [Aspergillus tubingensis]|uniref:ORC6 first cyclin-like domain-containing protein n=1 Tax=Aspergillus niger TaxID=5061 RepID=A0A100IIS0_ASPNG|nr:origin recognition complex, subunit 6 [Aspergillus tubingensis]GAQ42017.1 hypothetical protein ANI_1_1598094 [Aspergillus niger]GFN16623.1 origin recognition complex, subunit 6 [Aspergillus tubingensis]GLA97612.1 hypothetical protein AtubIFM57143_005540 [Aspergillus tubingensis]